ncbi:short chain dehydrogenase [Cohnella nanjingensis]|uniref:Short chain dehydrogenase n=1 Tax=Cohnella nanjingensis TaxID=1387779 RepID=A0A7X0VEY6_9BACL|nr:short chain dehydrogenase [Cohnella nanjingensis]MBB6671482.1 short chain dehydrogenase [Cohnella nanjingensis]
MKKRMIVIGGTGIIGSAVAEALEPKHEVIRASRHGEVRADLDDPASVDALFASTGPIDAVVCVAQSGTLTPIDSDRWDEDFDLGMKKLTGQVALFRRAIRSLKDNGSITLTSGTFKEPMVGSAVGHIVNSGLEGFVRAAAVELPRGIRANVVSPGWVRETLAKLGMDPSAGTPASEVARAYAAAIEGDLQGRILTP